MSGPGTELHTLIDMLGIKPKSGCGCQNLIRNMNDWGVEGCWLRRTRIVTALKEGAKKYGWGDVWQATAKSISTGLAMKMARHPFNPLMGLVEEAIERAKPEQASGGPTTPP